MNGGMNITMQKLSHNMGTEGPKHDPWAWDEWVVTRKLQYGPTWTYRLRVGICTSVLVEKDGKLVTEWREDIGNSGVILDHWRRLTGIKAIQLQRVYQRIHGPYDRCPFCGSRHLGCSSGFVGEDIQYCKDCQQILYEEDPTRYIQ